VGEFRPTRCPTAPGISIFFLFYLFNFLKDGYHDAEFGADALLAAHQYQVPAHVLAYHVRDGEAEADPGLVHLLIGDLSVGEKLKKLFLLLSLDPGSIVLDHQM